MIRALPSICHRTYFHTSKDDMTWIIRKLIGFLRVVVWHMRVSARDLEITWLECGLEPFEIDMVIWSCGLDVHHERCFPLTVKGQWVTFNGKSFPVFCTFSYDQNHLKIFFIASLASVHFHFMLLLILCNVYLLLCENGK